jgi:hypothetical protein
MNICSHLSHAFSREDLDLGITATDFEDTHEPNVRIVPEQNPR